MAVQDFDGVAVEDGDNGDGRKPKACQFSLQSESGTHEFDNLLLT